MNHKFVAATLCFLTAISSHRASASCCGVEAESYKVKFHGAADTGYYGQTVSLVTMDLTVTVGGKQIDTDGPVEGVLSVVTTNPPNGTFEMKPKIPYQGTAVLAMTNNEVGCTEGSINVDFDPEDACKWDFQMRWKKPGTDEWTEWQSRKTFKQRVDQIVDLSATFEVKLMEKGQIMSPTPPTVKPSSGDEGANGGGGSGSSSASTQAPTIAELYRDVDPSPNTAPQEVIPPGFTYSLPLRANSTSDGYSTGSITLSGPLDSTLALLSRVEFSGGGMAGVKYGQITTGSPPNQVATRWQVHVYDPVTRPLQEVPGDVPAMVQLEVDPSVSLSMDEMNEMRSKSNLGTLYDVSSIPGGVAIRCYDATHYDPVSPSAPPEASDMHGTGSHTPFKSVFFQSVSAAGDHLGGVRVTTYAANQVPRTREYVRLPLGGRRESFVQDNVILESTDYTSAFLFDDGRWRRIDTVTVTRGGHLFSKTDSTWEYQVLRDSSNNPIYSVLMQVEEGAYHSGSAAPLVTTWTPFADPDKDQVGKPASMTRSDGYWESYSYYSEDELTVDKKHWKGRLKEVLRPWNNAPASPAGATTSNAESTITTYSPRPTGNEQRRGVVPWTRVTTRPSGSSNIVVKKWARREGNAPSILSYMLSEAGLSNKYVPTSHAVRMEGSSEEVGGEEITTSSFYYNWSVDGGPWANELMGQMDEEGDGFAIGYERGHYTSTGPGSYTFTANNPTHLDTENPWGTYIRSVKVNVIGGGMPVDSEATREVIVRTARGLPLVKEFSIRNSSGDWTVASTTTYDYQQLWGDGTVKSVVIRQDGRVTYEGSARPVGQAILFTDIDEQGIEVRTLVDAIGRPTKTTRMGVSPRGTYPSQPKIVTDYTYTGRTTTETVVAGDLSRTTIDASDLMGRPVSFTDASGAVTSTSYPNQGRDVRVDLPGGREREEVRNIDGRTIAITGDAVVNEFFAYSVAPAVEPPEDPEEPFVDNGGNTITTRRLGTSNSPRYAITETDLAGRTAKVTKPSPSGTGEVVQTYSYWNGTRRTRSIASSADPRKTLFIRDMWYEYSLASWSGYDRSGDDDLSDWSNDFLEETRHYYEVDGNDIGWEVRTHKVYDSSSSAITRTTRRRLHSNLSGTSGETVSSSSNGPTITSTERISLQDKSSTVTVASSAASNDGIIVNINGLEVARSGHDSTKSTRYEHNALGEIVKVTSPRNEITYRSYYADGSLKDTTDHAGKITGYSYYGPTHPSAGKLWTVTNPLQKTTTYAYSTLGKITEVAGTAAYRVTYDYDTYGAMDEMRTSRDATTSDLTTWGYQDGTGLLTSKTDAASKSVTYTYYASGKLKKRSWARNVDATYYYDQEDESGYLRKIDYSDSTPDVELLTLDRLGRPQYIKQGGVTVEEIGYHPGDGVPKYRHYPSNNPQLRNRAVHYDALDSSGRQVNVKETSGSSTSSPTLLRTVDYGYDPTSGRLQTITDGSQNHVYAYHPNSSLVSSITSNASSTAWFKEVRSYDSLSRLVGIRSSRMSGSSVTANISSHSYRYDSLGRRTRNTFGDGSYWEYGYNDRSEVTSATRKTSGGTIVAPLGASYTYDGIGNRLTSTSQVLGDHSYTPNSRNQYATVTTGNSRSAVGRAPASGWTIQVDGTNATRIGEIYHRSLTASNSSAPVWKSVVTKRSTGTPSMTTNFWYAKASVTPAYDDDGNLTNDGRWVYSWDAENRLIQMETTTAATTAGHPYTKLKFVYDWQGRRIARTVWQGGSSGSPTPKSNHRWLYDGWNVIAEFTAANETTTTVTRANTFTWGLDLSGTLQGAGGVGGLLVQTAVSVTPNVIERASYDGNGNIVAWTKSNSSAPTSRREYDAFGNTLVSEGTAPSTFGFSTKMQDVETGLCYYGYRYYDPVNGRWLSRDPISERGGLNLYAFVNNGGVNRWDRLGLDWNMFDQLTKNRSELLDKAVNSGLGRTPKCQSPCRLVTLIIELPNPTDSFPNSKIGHSGIAFDNGQYYDFGPENGENESPGDYWWDNPTHSAWGGTKKTPDDIELNDILSGVKSGKLGSGYDVVQVEWCVCGQRAGMAESYMKDMYKNIDSGKRPQYAIPGLHCTSSVCSAIYGRKPGDVDFGHTAPEDLLKKMMNDENTCGGDSGEKPNFKIINRASK